MNTLKTCPGCHQALAANAPDGLCPQCLMQAALGTGVDGGPDTPPRGAQRAFVAPTPDELGPFFPQLEILELLGRGGMGAVYKARQIQLDRLVAVKILPPGIGGTPAFTDRFTREARALAKLNHPNIVTLYEFGQTDGLFYFIMEFVDGLNLRQLLDAGRIAAREALAIVPQICDALQYAHDAAIVHRDIKPENILLDRRGRVKVADFGLAKIILQGRTGSLPVGSEDTGKLPVPHLFTEPGKVMGTPPYMAPEQSAHPAEVDHRADIYSLGVVFYQMLTGELPDKPLQPPSSRVQIDVRLDEVVLRALEKDPTRRYQQVSAVKTMVETIVSSGSAAAPEGTRPTGVDMHKSGMVRILEIGLGSSFTSPRAIQLSNMSALGFLGFIGCLGFLPFPGSHWCFGLFSFFGFFGLSGAAVLVEMIARSKSGRPDAALRHIIVVGRLGGKAVIHWPGVLLGFFLALAIAEIAAITASLISEDRIDTNAMLMALFAALLVTGIRIRRGQAMPVEQLISLDEPPSLTGFQPVRGDSASRLSADETTGLKPVGHDRRDACPPAAPAVLGVPPTATGAPPYFHRPRSLRDRWPWDATYLSGLTAILAPLPAILAVCLMPVLGTKALLLLLLELIPVFNAVVYFSILRRVDKLRESAAPDARELAEGLLATRALQTPCLAVLADDRLDLLGVAGQPISIPLSDIEAVTVIRWFNGKRLWWKRGLKIQRRSGPAVAMALAEPVFLRWQPFLAGKVQHLQPVPPKGPATSSPVPRSNMHGRKVMLTGSLMALAGFGAALLLRMAGAGHPGANHAIVFVAHPLACVGFAVMLVGSLMARSSMKGKAAPHCEQSGFNPPEGVDGTPATSLPVPAGMGAASPPGRAGVNQSNSTSAILACVLVAVAAALLFVLPRALPAQYNIEAMLRELWTVMIAGGVWAVACILTIVSVMRACYRKCNWRWPAAAVSLCVVLPAVFGVWWYWPSQDRMVHAAACGNQRVVSLALWLGCDINAPLKFGLGFNPVNAPLRNGQTAMTAAICGRQESMVQYLITRGADVNRPDGEGQTPLMAAVISGSPLLVEKLLHAGATPGPAVVNRAILLLEECHNGLRVQEELPARQKIVALLKANEETYQRAAPTRQIRVTLDRTRMAALGLTVDEVRAAMPASGPGGEQDPQSFIITTRNGNPVRLQDIATICVEESGQAGPLKDTEIVIPEATGQRKPQSDLTPPSPGGTAAAEMPGELKELNLTKEQSDQVNRWLQKQPQRPNPAAYARFVESILHDDQKAPFRKMMEAGGSSPQNP